MTEQKINDSYHIQSHWYRCQLCGEGFSEHSGNVTERYSLCEDCSKRKPPQFCVGNPTKLDCMLVGYCQRERACND